MTQLTQLKSSVVALMAGTAVLVAGGSAVYLMQTQNPSQVVQAKDTRPQNDLYNDVLRLYVNDQGQVNYQALQANRRSLDRFNDSLGAIAPDVYESWSEAEQIAFLLNAYNAFTLETIIDQSPIRSIRRIPGAWRVRQFSVAGQSKTLDDIEHQVLRVQFNEPRIHAALVCAAVSCPPLRTEPYEADQLDDQLDDQVQKWLNSPAGLSINREANRVSISMIFDWFGDDWLASYAVADGFTGSDRDRAVLNFISGYLSEGDRQYLQQGGYELSYLEYDWSLNRQ